MKDVSKTVCQMKTAVPQAKCVSQTALLEKLDSLSETLLKKANILEEAHKEAQNENDLMKAARIYSEKVVPAMKEARKTFDQMEPLLGENYKPFPCYEDLLFRV